MPARFSAADYAAAARALLPRGRLWPNDPDTVQSAVLSGFAGTFEASDAAAVDLLTDAFPATADALLPEWEDTLGLPDGCLALGATLEQRRAQVAARLSVGGGQSADHFVRYAASLGFGIEIETYAPFRVGIDGAGDPVGGEDWTFVWGVRALGSASGLPVDVLLCELNGIKPAHTTLILIS